MGNEGKLTFALILTRYNDGTDHGETGTECDNQLKSAARHLGWDGKIKCIRERKKSRRRRRRKENVTLVLVGLHYFALSMSCHVCVCVCVW